MSQNKIDLVIYHAMCSDGMSAAWAAHKLLGNRATYIAAMHGEPPPDVKGKRVAILDFSYKREILLKMIDDADSLIVIDHHKSAQIDLEGIPEAKFDMTKSGAMLSWEYFHPEKEAPRFIKYIQDRDLWQWKLPYSREFSAAFEMVPFNFSEYDAYSHDSIFDAAVERGAVILEHKRNYINKLIEKVAKRIIRGKSALVINSFHWISEVGEVLSQEADVGVIWFYDHNERIYRVSLRTQRDDIDVSEIAKTFGGGGHKAAAGFIWKGSSIEEIFDK